MTTIWEIPQFTVCSFVNFCFQSFPILVSRTGVWFCLYQFLVIAYLLLLNCVVCEFIVLMYLHNAGLSHAMKHLCCVYRWKS